MIETVPPISDDAQTILPSLLDAGGGGHVEVLVAQAAGDAVIDHHALLARHHRVAGAAHGLRFPATVSDHEIMHQPIKHAARTNLFA